MLNAILKTCEDELKNERYDPINDPINRLDKVISLMIDDNGVIIEQLADYCDVSAKTIKRDISKLKEQGVLVREGSLKSGTWRINQ